MPSVWVVGESSEVMDVEIILSCDEVTTVDALAHEFMPGCSAPSIAPCTRSQLHFRRNSFPSSPPWLHVGSHSIKILVLALF